MMSTEQLTSGSRGETVDPELGRVGVAVVICAFSLARLDQTRRCIEAVGCGARRPDELIVVVDNNPELLELLAEAAGGRATVVANAGHGLSDGRNTGLRLASSEVIVFIDDDAWPEQEWLDAMVEPFADRSLIGVGGHAAPDWEDPTLALPPELYWVVGSTYRGHREEAGPITRPIGVSMAARRDALLELGGFSSDFGRAGKAGSNEELAMFSEVARRFGSDRVWFAPRARVHHFAPASRCGREYLYRRSVMEGRSKAEIRARYGAESMAHDRGYVLGVVFASAARYLATGILRRDRVALRHGAQVLGCFVVTASAYGLRRAKTLASRRRSR